MPRKRVDPERFSFDVVKVLHTKEQDKKNKTVLQIVKWKRAKKPALENRRMYYNEDLEEWHIRKQAGIGPEEWAVIQANADEITRILTAEEE